MSERSDMIARRTLAIFREKVIQLVRQAEDTIDDATSEKVRLLAEGEADGYACVLYLLDQAIAIPDPPALDSRVTEEGKPVASKTVARGAFTITRTAGSSKTVTLTREQTGKEVCCADQALAEKVAWAMVNPAILPPPVKEISA